VNEDIAMAAGADFDFIGNEAHAVILEPRDY
jgi:hypothetical protein